MSRRQPFPRLLSGEVWGVFYILEPPACSLGTIIKIYYYQLKIILSDNLACIG